MNPMNTRNTMDTRVDLGPIAELRLARESPFALCVGAAIGGAAPIVNFFTVHCARLTWFDGERVHFASWDNPLWLMVLGSFALSSKSVLLWGRNTFQDWWCAAALVAMLEGALIMAPHPALGWSALAFLVAINAARYGGVLALRDRRDRAAVEPVPAHVPTSAPVEPAPVPALPAAVPAPVEADTDLYTRAVEVARGTAALSAKTLRQHLGVRHETAAALVERLTAAGVLGELNNRGQRVVLLSA